ncbi:thiamine ABC transporter permease [Rhizobium sp. Root274]|uniref:thiamine/thiamine pyrophosphate ABC transporter permease ThiP n=1 Tax=unclassified Rhizobium TaxID=2613769 RepID=UPI000712664C|nr:MULTISPECIES: thiamine/thiamine pyrophosphate ABC transporter permease ThiP [unclassified Rhizobium]KQW27884.1 thiamine ABC transporter permease [Rhizobium sp. Root1240]KRD28165.1 thiamine ABC transporter permease [Rhizobium sp. Root274]
MLRPLHQSWRVRLPALAGGLFVLMVISGFVGVALVMLLSGPVAGLELFADPVVRSVLGFTLWQALLSTLLSVGLALPFASALARQSSFPGRPWLIRLMALPMGLPVLIGALGLIGVFGRNGLINQLLSSFGVSQPVSIYGLSGILIAHVFFNLPLAARLMLSALERVPAEYWRSAASLGFSPFSTFRFIEWPVLARVIPGAAGLIFMLCVTSFTLVLVFGGGPAATTIEVAIYQALRFDFDPARAVSLACVQITVTGCVLAVFSLLPAASDTGATSGRGIVRFDGRRPIIRLVDGLMLVSGGLFLVLPLGQVVVSGLRADLVRLLKQEAFQQAALTSLMVSLGAGLAATLGAYLVIAARSQLSGHTSLTWTARLFSISLAGASSLVLLIPTSILATGWFLALRPHGDIAGFTPLLVVGINALMALPFAVRVLGPAFSEHRDRTGRLSESLGLSVCQRLRFVDWPALRRPFLTALAFAMALSLGDLGAVALFGSENITTLPTLIYAHMGSYRSNDADGLALILGLICLVLALIGAPGTSPGAHAKERVHAG